MKKKEKDSTNMIQYYILSVLVMITITGTFLLIDLIQKNNQNQVIECQMYEGQLKENCLIKYKVCENDDCYFKKARTNNNLTECNNIKDEEQKIICKSVTNHDKIIQEAVLYNNITICDQIQIEYLEQCRNNFYYVNSVNFNDKSLCQNISVEEFKNECLQR